MKIAISSTEPNPEGQVDLRFGRCACFALVDVDKNTYEFSENAAAALKGGAGLQAAQALVDAGVEAVITGNIGANAIKVLKAAGIKAYHCGPGSVRNALQKYKNGKLRETSGYKTGASFRSSGVNRGGGMGTGRGMGGGRGQR
jgi:predicted Fe-Mo cluster-binding NifX family protein